MRTQAICQSARTWRRRAFSLPELLTCTGILAILVSLLMPAVQRARETARQTQCRANLKSLGAACEAVQLSLGRYPRYIQSGVALTASGHVEMLPHLDHFALFNQIDKREVGAAAHEPPYFTHNAALAGTGVPAFVCPSDNLEPGGNSYRACLGSSTGIHRTWTHPVGELMDPSVEGLRGVFCRDHSARDIRDGLSNTVLFSERLAGDRDTQVYRPAVDVAVLPRFDTKYPDAVVRMCQRVPPRSKHFSYSGSAWLIGHLSTTAYNHVLTPNSSTPDCIGAEILGLDLTWGAHTARSYHPGGVNVCMADGAVKFVSEEIDLKLWRAIASINGGEVVSEF